MTTTCPHCGKPLRPGSRFCGNCGNSIPGTPSPRAVSPKPGPAGYVCPHCNEPVRPEARFCNKCGRSLDQGITQPSAPPAVDAGVVQPAEPVAGPLPAPPPSQGPAVEAVPGAVTAPIAPPAPVREKPRKRRWVWVLLTILVVGCGLVAATAFFFLRNQDGFAGFALFQKATPTVAPVPSATSTLLLAATDTPIPTDTLAPTETPLPTPTLTFAPTETISLTVEVSPTATLASPSPEATVLLEDNFDGIVSVNWVQWGSPHPTIRRGPLGNWLNMVSDEFGAAGVTSKQEIPNAPGIKIEFVARLNENFPNYSVVFDWDPVDNKRGPEYVVPGPIHLEIRRNSMVFKTPRTNEKCERDLTGAEAHTYDLQIVEGQGIDLYLDEDPLPACRIVSMGMEPTPGNISFTGLGWVIRVKVTK